MKLGFANYISQTLLHLPPHFFFLTYIYAHLGVKYKYICDVLTFYLTTQSGQDKPNYTIKYKQTRRRQYQAFETQSQHDKRSIIPPALCHRRFLYSTSVLVCEINLSATFGQLFELRFISACTPSAGSTAGSAWHQGDKWPEEGALLPN